MYENLMDTIGFVGQYDPEVAEAMGLELKRQRRNIELIASENIVSPAVMAAMGSVLTNKYAEGYPGKRYYGGCEDVDIVEEIARKRACRLFGAEHANVQPHSGAQANLAVYFALLKPGDTVLGMNLAHGGHLTHGSPVNLSGSYYNFVPYGINDEGFLEYDKLMEQAMEVKPKLIVAGASAYPRAIDFAKLREIADACGAYLMVDMAHIAGLVAKAVCFGEALKPEFKDYAKRIVENAQALAAGLTKRGFQLVSGGTDNHLMLVDLRSFDITGKDFEKKLDEVYITVNKNAIPNDPQSPFITSGIRVGTPAVTTRGFGTEDMDVIAECMYRTASDFEGTQDEVRGMVESLCAKHPLYE